MPAKRNVGWPPRWLTATTPAERKRGEGDSVARFVDDLCKITKDTVAGRVGEPIVCRAWQRELLAALFAKRKDGRRRHRQGLIGMPRKNGKSALGAAIALYGLLLDVEGAEVYSCAGEKDQARIVFGMAKRMVELEPELADLVKPYRDALEVPSTGSVYRCLSSEAFTKEGLSPTLVVFDEVHVQPNDELWDVMTLGSGARREPLILGITTAGARTDSLGRDSLCYRLYQHGQRVANGEIEDPSFFFCWWEPKAGTSADHRNPKVWKESNPGIGDIVDVEDFASTVVRTSESEFRTKRTNVWVTATESALPHGIWNSLRADRQVGDRDVVLMFDGSFSGDSTGIVGATIEEVPHLFLVDVWENPNDPNWRVPIPDVEQRIRDACKQWPVVEVSCDPYRWQRSLQALEDEGLPVVEFPNTLPRMIPAWQSFYEAAMDRRFTHDGHPTLARHVENMVLKSDSRGVRPVKESKNSRRHIDLGICAVGAHSRAIERRQTPGEPLLAFA